MKCGELISILNEYVDGDTQSELCQAIQEHLTQCNSCRVVIDNIRQTITLYREGEVTPLPAGLHEKLHSIMRQGWASKFSFAAGVG